MLKITNHTVTAEDILALGPCWDDAETRINELIPTTITLYGILKMPNVSDEDKVWAVTQLIKDKRQRVGVASIFARHVLHLTNDRRISECLDACDRYANGEDVDLSDAANAAYSAYSAARAARAAAYSAADAAYSAYSAADAANAAAYSAANAAANAAAYAAAYSAARAARAAAAARERQVELLLSMLEIL